MRDLRSTIHTDIILIDSAAIHAGLDNGEFYLEYLPAVWLENGQCIGAEALMRWRRPGGIVQPLDFIPVAENTLLSGLITYWVIDTVAAELGDWLHAHPKAHIAINVPPEVFGRGGILYATKKSRLDELATQLVLEVTERGLPDLLGINSFQYAKEKGVRIALDDITLKGPANLAVLARADFDIVKLDPSLAAQITAQCPHPDWLVDVALLTRSPRFTVIAEGIETEQQLATIRAAGVHAGQGFYFSRPVSAEALMAFFRERSTP